MRKYAFCLAIALLGGIWSAQAQLGIKAGINLATLAESEFEDSFDDYKAKAITGLQAGLLLDLPITDMFSLQPELIWIQKGGRSTYSLNPNNQIERRVTYNYVEVPVLFKIKAPFSSDSNFGLFLLGGPFAGFALNGKGEVKTTILGLTSTSTFDVDYGDEGNTQRRFDWGISAGLGAYIGSIFLDLRYNLGFNNLLDENAASSGQKRPTLRTRGIGLTAGFVFGN